MQWTRILTNFDNDSYTHSTFQYYIFNIKMWLYSQSKLEDHTTGKGDLWMPLTYMYVSFSYLSKVNLGRKVVHWTLTLIVHY